MQDVFSGQVKMVKGSYGFIDRSTLRNITTSDTDLRQETEQDIFFLTTDFPDARVYQELKFQVEADQKRGQDTFRAVRVEWVGIELHFPDRTIDHPTAAVRWCLSGEARRLVAESKNTTWYIAIVAQPHRRSYETSYSHRPGTTLSTWVGLKRIGDGFGFINFTRSGPHDVVAYLIASATVEKALNKHFDRYEKVDEIDVWEDTDRRVPATGVSDLKFTGRISCRHDHVRGLTHVVVDVPEGIFAKPLPQWLKKWLAYFKVERQRDECDMRGKVILACTLGPFAFLVWEFVKRLWMLVLGIFHFCLAGGSPLPLWRRAVTSDLSARISNWAGELEYQELTEWTDDKVWCHPLPWTVLTLLLTWLMLAPADKRAWPLALLAAVFVIVAAIVVFVFFGEGLTAFFKRFKTERTEQRKQAVMGRIERYASCDLKTAEVMPPRTVRLSWSGIKRYVCRTYAD